LGYHAEESDALLLTQIRWMGVLPKTLALLSVLYYQGRDFSHPQNVSGGKAKQRPFLAHVSDYYVICSIVTVFWSLAPITIYWFVNQKGLRNLTFMEPCIARCVFYITNEMQLIQRYLLLSSALYMFRAGFPPIIRSL